MGPVRWRLDCYKVLPSLSNNRFLYVTHFSVWPVWGRFWAYIRIIFAFTTKSTSVVVYTTRYIPSIVVKCSLPGSFWVSNTIFCCPAQQENAALSRSFIPPLYISNSMPSSIVLAVQIPQLNPRILSGNEQISTPPHSRQCHPRTIPDWAMPMILPCPTILSAPHLTPPTFPTTLNCTQAFASTSRTSSAVRPKRPRAH